MGKMTMQMIMTNIFLYPTKEMVDFPVFQCRLGFKCNLTMPCYALQCAYQGENMDYTLLDNSLTTGIEQLLLRTHYSVLKTCDERLEIC